MVRLLLAVAWLGCASPTMAQLTGVEGRVPLPTEDDWNRVSGSYHLRVCQRGGMCADDADPDVLLTYIVSIQRVGMPTEVVAPDGFNACYVVVRTIRHAHPMYSSLSGVGVFDARLGKQDAKVGLVLGGGA